MKAIGHKLTLLDVQAIHYVLLCPGNMASFEVEMLIRKVPPGGLVTLLLKYNPIGGHTSIAHLLFPSVAYVPLPSNILMALDI